MKIVNLLIVAACLQASFLYAEDETGSPSKSQACEEAVTVFQDVSRMGRKDRAASNMTRRHREMAEEGWRFVDLEVYTENADIEGFFLSYVRSVACPAGTLEAR